MGFPFSGRKEGAAFLESKDIGLFLERHAISQEQYNKSLNNLTIKMGMQYFAD